MDLFRGLHISSRFRLVVRTKDRYCLVINRVGGGGGGGADFKCNSPLVKFCQIITK